MSRISVVCLRNILYICNAEVGTSADIFYEGVFRTPYLKMWKFSELREKRMALISCIAMRLCTFCACTSYYPSVGHCIVCFSSGIPQPSSRHSKINSTLSFYINPPHRSCYGKLYLKPMFNK